MGFPLTFKDWQWCLFPSKVPTEAKNLSKKINESQLYLGLHENCSIRYRNGHPGGKCLADAICRNVCSSHHQHVLFVVFDLTGQGKFPAILALRRGRIDKIFKNIWNPSPLSRRVFREHRVALVLKDQVFFCQHLTWKFSLSAVSAGKVMGVLGFPLSHSLTWVFSHSLNTWQWGFHCLIQVPVQQQKACV